MVRIAKVIGDFNQRYIPFQYFKVPPNKLLLSDQLNCIVHNCFAPSIVVAAGLIVHGCVPYPGPKSEWTMGCNNNHELWEALEKKANSTGA
jgi:hypothetical protein